MKDSQAILLPAMQASPETVAPSPSKKRTVTAGVYVFWLVTFGFWFFYLQQPARVFKPTVLSKSDVGTPCTSMIASDVPGLLPYVPGPGRWESEPHPTDIILEYHGFGTGEIVIVASDEVRVASTTVTFLVSDEDAKKFISVVQEDTAALPGRYKMSIDVFHDAANPWEGIFMTVKAQITLTLPARQYKKMSLSIVSDLAEVTVVENLKGRVALDTVTIKTGRGVYVKGLEADGPITLTDGLNLVAEDLRSPAITFESTDKGRIDATRCTATEDLVIRAEMGSDVLLGHVSAANLRVGGNAQGRIGLQSVKVSKSATLTVLDGSVSGDLEVGASGSLRVRGNNGKIEMEVGGRPESILITTGGSVALDVKDRDFAGRFELEAGNSLGVHGRDVHVDKQGGKGWVGAEDGKQSVVVRSEGGKVDLTFL
ncbi:hypothetical protein HKX48_000220 [Thoreauomyces humboldtii]|nr:hypothetical protein HKX48_000220 [Thoreauomyces humboldtii]